MIISPGASGAQPMCPSKQYDVSGKTHFRTSQQHMRRLRIPSFMSSPAATNAPRRIRHGRDKGVRLGRGSVILIVVDAVVICLAAIF